MNEGLISSFVEVKLTKPDNFLVVAETLTRVGIGSRQKKTLVQSCHILHKRGKYYICHFKEMMKLDGKQVLLTEEDIARRNSICDLLVQWQLVELIDPDKTKEPKLPANRLLVLKHSDKDGWHLSSKYTMGHKHHQRPAYANVDESAGYSGADGNTYNPDQN